MEGIARQRFSRRACFLDVILLILAAMPAAIQGQNATNANYQTSDVRFQTEDGWTIYASLYLPKATAQAPVPALIVLNEPGGPGLGQHTGQIGANISAGVAGRIGMAALNMEVRGTGYNFGKKYFEEFSPEERDGIQLDIRAAIKFLSAQKGIDRNRIAVLAPSLTAEYAVREAAHNVPQVKALVLITGSLSDKSRETIQARSDLPILAIASKDDTKTAQMRAAEPYFLSENTNSSLMFVIDRGAAIFNRPGHVIEQVSDWLKKNVGALGTATEVSFQTEDGWTLWGTLFVPDSLEGKKVPGVIFVHGQNHDVQTWYYLARDVAKSGLAVLTFDRRANGKSVWERGPTPPGSGAGNPLDVKAAMHFMASQKAVDANRMALIAATAVATATITASMGDPRIKTIVGLSLYGADDNVKQYLSKSDVPLFLLASTGDVNADGGSLTEASRELRRLSKSKESELIIFDGAGRGSNIQQVRPEVNAMIVRWLNEKLSR